MKIQKQDYEKFRKWCYQFFKEQRKAKGKEVVAHLKLDDEKLLKKIEKAVGKKKAATYISRSLLGSIRKYGWLTYEKNHWVAKPQWGQCTYCFSELEDIYMIDAKDQQYCDGDCFDEHGASEFYDSYIDDYLSFFSDFKNLKENYTIFLQKKLEPSYDNHLQLAELLEQIEELLNDNSYSTIWFNGGDDGPLAAEMSRMLSILQNDFEAVQKEEARIYALRPRDNKRYSLIIDQQFHKHKAVKKFMKKNEKYRESSTTWTTNDATLRSDWYYSLHDLVTVTATNEIKCPACQEITEEKWGRTLADGFSYCCY